MGKMPMPRAVSPSSLRSFLLDDLDFLVCQAVEFVNELINLVVGFVNLALGDGVSVGGSMITT